MAAERVEVEEQVGTEAEEQDHMAGAQHSPFFSPVLVYTDFAF